MMLRQLQLLPAGCQPWNANMLDGTESKFAYCSTLAVYIYERLSDSQQYKLSSINAEHEKTISSISWNKKKTNLIATAGSDLKILVWDVSKQKVVARLRDLKCDPVCIDWVNSGDSSCITYLGSSGYLEEWNITNAKVTVLKNVPCITTSRVTIFRWHHTKQETIAFGYDDGTVCVFKREKGTFKKRKIRFYEDPIEDDKVLLLSWDPLSQDYILIANKVSGIKMVDTVSGEIITKFCLPSKAVATNTFSWIHSAPGMFLTGDRESGILRLWTVGQESPLINFKIKATGFNGIHVLNIVHGVVDFDENFAYGSHRRKPSHSQNVQPSVPPANVVCTFRDGGVGLYDLQRRKWTFLKEQGHIETIFDCKFKADDPKILATASFDGTVKIWSTSSLLPVKTSTGNEGVVYSICWAPENLDCIVCGTRRRGVFIWDFKKEKVIKRFDEHGKYCVFCVAWSHKDSHKIASGSEDCTCVVRRLDGENMHRLHHPGVVYGCDWNIHDKVLLATGCDDGNVRVWSVDVVPQCNSVLKGHSRKVFHVRWHPLIKNILCSGSDDCAIRIWDTSLQSPCIAVLEGHTDRVRGLSWNNEIPYLLVSGSWDSTIRVWDVREQKCLDITADHGADVYGLDSHPSSPFILASSSRDSTVRIWSLAPHVSNLFAKILLGHNLDSILTTSEEAMKSNLGDKLVGRMSRQITDEVARRPDANVVKLRWFSEFFTGNPALENLWDIAFSGQGASETAMSPEYRKGIVHQCHMIKYATAEAQELELSVSSKTIVGNRLQEAILERAAALQLKAGNLRKHCDILKILGRWETALSLAPGVSIKYWSASAKEYAQILEGSGNNEYLPYRIAIGDSTKCIRDLLKLAEYEDALLVVQSACEGRISAPRSNDNNQNQVSESLSSSEHNNGCPNVDEDLEKLRNKCYIKLSHAKLICGDAVRGATYLLSKNDLASALNILVQGNELLITLCLGIVLKRNDESVKEAVALYARKLEHQGNYYFAIEMLRTFLQCSVNDENWTPIHASCSRCIGDELHRSNLHEYAGLSPPSMFTEMGDGYITSGNQLEAMRCFLLSTRQSKALEIGLEMLKKELSREKWNLENEAITQLSVVFTISSVIVEENSMGNERNQLLAISSFLGCLKALKFGFLTMVTPLLEHAIAMTERVEMANREANFPISSQDLRKYLSEWIEFSSKQTFPSQKKVRKRVDWDKVALFGFANVQTLVPKEVVVVGSSLPSHSDMLISTLTNQQINGPKFCLDDGLTTISLNEAIMWARVNEFSPIGRGKRIVPF